MPDLLLYRTLVWLDYRLAAVFALGLPLVDPVADLLPMIEESNEQLLALMEFQVDALPEELSDKKNLLSFSSPDEIRRLLSISEKNTK